MAKGQSSPEAPAIDHDDVLRAVKDALEALQRTFRIERATPTEEQAAVDTPQESDPKATSNSP